MKKKPFLRSPAPYRPRSDVVFPVASGSTIRWINKAIHGEMVDPHKRPGEEKPIQGVKLQTGLTLGEANGQNDKLIVVTQISHGNVDLVVHHIKLFHVISLHRLQDERAHIPNSVNDALTSYQ